MWSFNWMLNEATTETGYRIGATHFFKVAHAEAAQQRIDSLKCFRYVKPSHRQTRRAHESAHKERKLVICYTNHSACDFNQRYFYRALHQ